jgi:2-polyprenyl-3-methyl-5-hydroxy-6-metoxy-1,4-benzoquinol methylase
MKNYWDREIDKFDRIYEKKKNILERFVDIFRKDIILERARIAYSFAKKLENGSTVVDIGCGTGRQAIRLAKMGFKVYGYDISERAIELAKLRAKAKNINVIFEKCDVVRKEYPQCDLVIGLGLMDYLSNDKVKLILRQLKDLNCKFIFSFPCSCSKSYIRFIYRYISGTKIFLRNPDEISDQFISCGIDNLNIISENLGASIVVHNF